VTVFRPSARVTSPDGRDWEIYAYKVKLRDLDDFGLEEDDVFAGRDGPLVFLVNLVLLIPRLFIRLGQAAVGGLEAIRSDEWTIDAITFYPQQIVYTWTTTSEHKGQVLAQVEGHLARGDIPLHLTNAVYRRSTR
jgi:hypothetical protein